MEEADEHGDLNGNNDDRYNDEEEAYQSDDQTELEVQSREQPPQTNGSSTAEREPVQERKTPNTKTQEWGLERREQEEPVQNGNTNNRDQEIARRGSQRMQKSQPRQAQPAPTPPKRRQQAQPNRQRTQTQQQYQPEYEPQYQQQYVPQQQQMQQQQQQYQQVQQPQYFQGIPPRAEGYRTAAIRESRIKDRPQPASGASDSALKIKIELDLEVEVDLYARVKGDVTIGLM